MKKELIYELKRKAIHLLAIIYIVIFVFFSRLYGKSLGLFALVVLLIVFLLLDFIRVELKKSFPIIGKLWRKKEEKKFGGQVFFLLGSIIVFSVFELNIAIAAILMTVFGDMVGALVGIQFGKNRLKNGKSLEGGFAEFVINLVIGYFVVGNLIVVLVMGLTASIIETSIRELDDNLMIPVFAGFSGHLVLIVLKFLNI